MHDLLLSPATYDPLLVSSAADLGPIIRRVGYPSRLVCHIKGTAERRR